MMHVPHHITVMGAESNGEFNHLSRYQYDNNIDLASKMNVPDRILVAGGDSTRADRAPPTEVMADRFQPGYAIPELETPPETLTLDKANYPDIPDEESPNMNNSQPQVSGNFYVEYFQFVAVKDESMSAASIAVDENPLGELKKMRRQMGRISTRLLQLEDENERRKSRESLIWLSLITTAGLILTMIFQRGGFK
ncbi:unnamed protein product [Anisakis simplex]|uniref:Mitochondrial fission factor n=1 Tax=Anisakis simplex TaxID=6269 RepID=A0A0M3IYL2_ANISI|nr:unnamed protein product [Anisakis simplex]